MSMKIYEGGVPKALTGGLLRAALLALLLTSVCAAARLNPRSPAALSPTEVKVTLKSTGFEPGEVMCDTGRLRLTVINQSGKDNLTFRLVKATGQEVLRGQPTAGSADWSQEVELAAGRYVLTEINNPDWKCYVTAF